MKGYGKESLLMAIESISSGYQKIENKRKMTIDISGKRWVIDSQTKEEGSDYQSLKKYLTGKDFMKVSSFMTYAYIGLETGTNKAKLYSEDGATELINVSKKDIILLNKTGIVVEIGNTMYALNENAKNMFGKLLNCSYAFRKYSAKTLLYIIAEELTSRNLYFWTGTKTDSFCEVVNVTALKKPEGLLNAVNDMIQQLENEMSAVAHVKEWTCNEKLCITFGFDIFNNKFANDCYVYVEIANEKVTLLMGYYNDAIIGCYYSPKFQQLLNDFTDYIKSYDLIKDKVFNYNGEFDNELEVLVGKRRMFDIPKGSFTGEHLYKAFIRDMDLPKEWKIKYLRFIGKLPLKLIERE